MLFINRKTHDTKGIIMSFKEFIEDKLTITESVYFKGNDKEDCEREIHGYFKKYKENLPYDAATIWKDPITNMYRWSFANEIDREYVNIEKFASKNYIRLMINPYKLKP